MDEPGQRESTRRDGDAGDGGFADDPVYLHARRESLVAFLGWLVAGTVTVTVCAVLGYDVDPARITTVLGVPSWVFWGVLVPWMASIVFAVWYSLWFIKDEDLGEEPEDE